MRQPLPKLLFRRLAFVDVVDANPHLGLKLPGCFIRLGESLDMPSQPSKQVVK